VTTPTCTACGGDYVEGVTCPARGDGAHRRRGRPPLGDAKREPVQVYLTADERAELEAYAEREEATLAGAIREAALRAARWRP
jgi:hypothetical protein